MSRPVTGFYTKKGKKRPITAAGSNVVYRKSPAELIMEKSDLGSAIQEHTAGEEYVEPEPEPQQPPTSVPSAPVPPERDEAMDTLREVGNKAATLAEDEEAPQPGDEGYEQAPEPPRPSGRVMIRRVRRGGYREAGQPAEAPREEEQVR